MGVINFLKNIIGTSKVSLKDRPSNTVGFDENSLSRNIGITKAECPYCFTELDKKPSRKTKCPYCGEFIYKRTRPFDNTDILIREDQIDQIEEEWSIVNGSHDIYLKEKSREQRIRNEMRERFGREPDDLDVEFRVLNDRALEAEFSGLWGFARNSRLQMAKNLEKRKSPKLALRTFFHVCYLDINGPNNRMGMSSDNLQKYPYFTPETGSLSPGVIKRMKKLIEQLKYNTEDCRREFFEVNEQIHEASRTPLPPQDAWPKLRMELFEK